MAKVQIALSSGIALTVKGSRKLCKKTARQLAKDAMRLELLSQTNDQLLDHFAAMNASSAQRRSAG